MFSPSAVAIVLWALAEYLILRVLAGAIGVGSALLVTLAASGLALVIGWAKVRFFVADSVRSAVFDSAAGADGRGIAADRLVRIFAFVLCVVPGLASGAVGLALLVPGLRRRAAVRLAPRLTTASSISFGGFGPFGGGFGSRSTHGDVIDTDLIDTDLADTGESSGGSHNPHPPARTELG